MKSCFVTSSGTDIGKTHVCCQLIEACGAEIQLRCIKPVVTGFDSAEPESSDTARLLRAQRRPVDPAGIETTSPWRFHDPLSADMAAAREGKGTPFDELVAFSKPPPGIDFNLIEGIGGVMAPLDHRHTVLDWIAALQTSVLLVVGSYLGSLSHSLTAIDALDGRARRPQLIVISQSEAEPVATEETAASLKCHCPDIPITIFKRDEAAIAASGIDAIRQLLDF